jgi:hypothetical protein
MYLSIRRACVWTCLEPRITGNKIQGNQDLKNHPFLVVFVGIWVYSSQNARNSFGQQMLRL